MKLAVISHTEHFLNEHGQVVGWGPTVRELNHLLDIFDEIWHVAVLQPGYAPPSALPYESSRIHFVPIKPFGGPGILDKLKILIAAPSIIRTVFKTINKVDWWQFRAPTGMGVFLIPLLNLFVAKPGWFKYAGNWQQENAPIGYRWQRFLLSNLNRRKVTINGKWPGQKSHLISFENPCLTLSEREHGKQIIEKKSYSGPLEICFVGRLETEKGIGRVIEAFQHHPNKARFNKLHIIGDGPEGDRLKQQASKTGIHCQFYGWMSRDSLSKIFADCHLILLPSTASEGFPKVLAEAANYGCIPVTSDISSIPDYVSGMNGFLWHPETESFPSFFCKLGFSESLLKNMAIHTFELSGNFTFERYLNRISSEIVQVNVH